MMSIIILSFAHGHEQLVINTLHWPIVFSPIVFWLLFFSSVHVFIV